MPHCVLREPLSPLQAAPVDVVEMGACPSAALRVACASYRQHIALPTCARVDGTRKMSRGRSCCTNRAPKAPSRLVCRAALRPCRPQPVEKETSERCLPRGRLPFRFDPMEAFPRSADHLDWSAQNWPKEAATWATRAVTVCSAEAALRHPLPWAERSGRAGRKEWIGGALRAPQRVRHHHPRCEALLDS